MRRGALLMELPPPLAWSLRGGPLAGGAFDRARFVERLLESLAMAEGLDARWTLTFATGEAHPPEVAPLNAIAAGWISRALLPLYGREAGGTAGPSRFGAARTLRIGRLTVSGALSPAHGLDALPPGDALTRAMSIVPRGLAVRYALAPLPCSRASDRPSPGVPGPARGAARTGRPTASEREAPSWTVSSTLIATTDAPRARLERLATVLHVLAGSGGLRFTYRPPSRWSSGDRMPVRRTALARLVPTREGIPRRALGDARDPTVAASIDPIWRLDYEGMRAAVRARIRSAVNREIEPRAAPSPPVEGKPATSKLPNRYLPSPANNERERHGGRPDPEDLGEGQP